VPYFAAQDGAAASSLELISPSAVSRSVWNCCASGAQASVDRRRSRLRGPYQLSREVLSGPVRRRVCRHSADIDAGKGLPISRETPSDLRFLL